MIVHLIFVLALFFWRNCSSFTIGGAVFRHASLRQSQNIRTPATTFKHTRAVSFWRKKAVFAMMDGEQDKTSTSEYKLELPSSARLTEKGGRFYEFLTGLDAVLEMLKQPPGTVLETKPEDRPVLGEGLQHAPQTRLDPLTGEITYMEGLSDVAKEPVNQTEPVKATATEDEIKESQEEIQKESNPLEDMLLMSEGKKEKVKETKEQEEEMQNELNQNKTEPHMGKLGHKSHVMDCFVEPARRWGEFDEYGDPIRDPVVRRNRRRKRGPVVGRQDTLFEGGRLMNFPDVAPNELQTLEAFQGGGWYAGGRPNFRTNHSRPWEREDFDPLKHMTPEIMQQISLEPRKVRVDIHSLVSNSSTNSSALDTVQKIYDYLKFHTDNDPRIDYHITVFTLDNETMPGMEHLIQMWSEGTNCYHLIDGLAMRNTWGCIMPHVVLSEGNLKRLLDQVTWALLEDCMDGVMLTPRMRMMRLQGKPNAFVGGYNTQEEFTEFSVINDS